MTIRDRNAIRCHGRRSLTRTLSLWRERVPCWVDWLPASGVPDAALSVSRPANEQPVTVCAWEPGNHTVSRSDPSQGQSKGRHPHLHAFAERGHRSIEDQRARHCPHGQGLLHTTRRSRLTMLRSPSFGSSPGALKVKTTMQDSNLPARLGFITELHRLLSQSHPMESNHRTDLSDDRLKIGLMRRTIALRWFAEVHPG